MRHPTHLAARRRARAVAVSATRDLSFPLMTGVMLLGLAWIVLTFPG